MDVIKSMKSFIKVSQVFGLFPYKVQKSCDFCFLVESGPLLRYSKVLFWFLALAEGGSIVSSNFSFDYLDDISARLVLRLSTSTLYLSFILIFRTIVKKRRVLCFWLNQFNSLCINSEVNCGKLGRFNRCLLLGTTFYFCLILITKYMMYDQKSLGHVFQDVIFFARLWVIHLFLKHFVLFANFVRCFYLKVHNKLREANYSDVYRSWVKVLRELRSNDLFVKEFAEVLNSVYMSVMLVHFMWFFVTLLCDITIAGKGGMPTILQLFWMVYICLETVLYTSVCHETVKEEQKMTWCLQNLLIHLDDPAVLNEVELFSLQLQHTDLNFNVLGFFVLDYTLLYSMIGATTTYTFILLQFQTDHMTKFLENSDRNTSFLVTELPNRRPVAKNTSF